MERRIKFATCLKTGLIASILLLTAACGGGTSVTLQSETDNSKIFIRLGEKRQLEKMESDLFGSFSSQENCLSYNSPFEGMANELILSLNGVLSELEKADDSLNGAVLLNGPPRETGTIAVYLCDGMKPKAYTLHRSVFISNEFLANLHLASIETQRVENFLPAAGFVLYHEIGHAALNHSAIKLRGENDEGGSSENSFDLPQELEADQFAFDIMVKTGLNLEGRYLAQSMVN